MVILPRTSTLFSSRNSKRKVVFLCFLDCCIIPLKHLKQLYSNTAIKKKFEIKKVSANYIMQYQLN